MVFPTASGNIDIQQGDWIRLMSGAFPVLDNTFPIVIVIDVSNHTQVKISYQDESGAPQTTWIDTSWFIGVLRPILPS